MITEVLNMSFRGYIIMVAILLSFNKQTACKDICCLNYMKAMVEPRRARLERNNICGQYMVRNAFVKSEIYCLEACYESEDCHSLYYEKQDGYCILYRYVTGSLWNVCIKISKSSDSYYALFDREAFHRMVSKTFPSKDSFNDL